MENNANFKERKPPSRLDVILSLVLLANLDGTSLAQNQRPDDSVISNERVAGFELSKSEAADVADQLAKYPERDDLRLKLLAYYFMQRTTSEEARSLAQPHILWLIENRADSRFAAVPEVRVNVTLDPERYQEAKKAWEQQVSKHPENPRILGNAADFLLLSDSEQAEEMLLKAQSIEPKNSVWSEKLGHLYSLSTISRKPLESSAAKALKAYQRSQEGTTGEKRFYALGDTAEAALKAGKPKLAKEYAEELLSLAPKFPKDWNYGNAIYTANSILGQIALADDNLAEAKAYLLAAGDTPGSPQLNSFGPDMTLPAALLKRGEKEAVMAFLDKISRFWKLKGSRINEWKESIRTGGEPAFEQTY